MDITLILQTNYATDEWVIRNNSYSELDWLSDSSKPTLEDLESQWSEVQAKVAAGIQAQIDAKASAVAKLQALGLTLEEVEVAFGLSE
jgi:hypothetical protein